MATPLGTITFHVVPANTLFLLYIQDIDRLGIELSNLRNKLIKWDTGVEVPIVCK